MSVASAGVIGAAALPTTMVSGHTQTGPAGAERTVSLGAVRHADGSVTGFARIDISAIDTSFVMDVNCLEVAGNVGKISGEVTQSNLPSLIGANVVFHVEDTGETPADPPDRVSAGFITSATCATFVIPAGHPGGLAPIDIGAIRVND
jgi:hypothetical protein